MLILTMIFQSAVWAAFTGALLLLPAGRLDWPQAWALLAEWGVLSLLVGLDIARRDPALMKERSTIPTGKDILPWDRVYVILLFSGFAAWYGAMGWEARSHLPTWTVWGQAGGGLLIAAGLWIAWLTLCKNSYASTTVKLQADRGQHVIDTGPYAWVRHPLYAGGVLILLGTPLLLGSRYGLIGAALVILLIAVRAVGEEKVLTAGLPGYADYMQKVRFRLVPGVW